MTNRNISDSRDFCCTLTEDAVRLLENLFQKHDLSVVIIAETADGYEQSFKNSEEFFEWSQYPRAPLRELSFSTLRSEKRYQVILTFGNGRRFPFLDDRQSAAIFWSLKGPAQIVTDVNENITKIITKIVLSLKQNYTVFFEIIRCKAWPLKLLQCTYLCL